MVKFKRAGFLTKIVVLALLIYLVTSVLDMRGRIQAVEEQRGELTKQVADQKLENQALEDAIANSDDPETLTQVARDKGLVEQGVELFIDVAN